MPIGRIGLDFVVDTTATGDQSNPTVSALADGRFVVAWQSADNGDGSGSCIRARIYNHDGGAAGNDFLVNTTSTSDQRSPDVAGLSDGRILVTWDSNDNTDGSGFGIRGRIFDADGNATANDFLVNTTGTNGQVSPAVTTLVDGGFLATWTSADTGDGSGGALRARVFDEDGNGAPNDYIVNTTHTNDQRFSSVTQLADGRLVATWESTDTGDTSGTCIRAVFMDAGGQVVGNDFVVNKTVTSNQTTPAVTALTDGGFVVTWSSLDTGDGDAPCVRGRVFDANGNAAPNDFLINSTGANDQANPAIAALADGHFVVAWDSTETGDGSGGCIRARVFNADGSSDMTDFIVDTTTAGNQTVPSVTALDDGRFVVTWVSADTGDGSGTCIRAQMFDATVFNGTAGADTWHGGDLADHITGGANGDNLNGLGGDDVISGDAGSDVLSGGDGNDILFGGDGIDTISGDAGDDVLFGNEGADFMFGDDGNDVLRGGAGSDLLNGGAGDDTMAGGSGGDSYFVDSPHDVVDEAVGGGNDSVSTTVSYVLKTGSEVETLRVNGANSTTAIDLTGNEFANVIEGNAGNNVLDGGGNADTMRGFNGNDTYIIDNPGDIADEGVSNGTDTVRSAITFSLSDTNHAKGDIENLVLTGTAPIDGTGNGLANVITGNGAKNTLSGGDGKDKLNGGLNADILTGGSGGDAFVFKNKLGSGNVDTITDFGNGNDAIDLAKSIFKGIGSKGALKTKYFANGHAKDGNDHIVYKQGNGKVFYDKNGDKAGGMTLFAKVDPGTHLDHTDFFVI
jgi:Ca2+-binding RTX toxin-like protein